MIKNSFLGTATAMLLSWSNSYADSTPLAGGPITFETQVRPILKAHCFECHGEGKKLKGGLDLRFRRLMVQGGKSGPVLVPGKHEASLLYGRISRNEMPPGKKKLSKSDVALIGRWIAEGARTAHPEPAKIDPGFQITPLEQAFWSFQPVRRPPLPRVQQPDRVRTPIDAYLLARLEEKGLTFAPEVDRQTLIRRAYFDLIGLPPSPEDVARFLADTSADAYERLLDRLLASPHYGERWGRHWLDVAGYADSEGYTEQDIPRKHAYKYRDYVIRAFNEDMPFDQFIQEQLAGDEMVRPPYQNLKPADIDKLVATGFLRMAPDGTSSGGIDFKLACNQVMADTIQIVSTAILGLTVNCAQCHNHRYDPIPQTDYYRLRAIFEPALDWKNWRAPPARGISLYTDADRNKAQKIENQAAKIDQARLKKMAEYIDQTFKKELAKLPESLREPVRTARNTPVAKRTDAQQKLLRAHPSVNVSAGSLYLYDHKAAEHLKKLAGQAAQVRAKKPVEDFIRALTEVSGKVPATFLFYRGDHELPKEAVTPGSLTIFAAFNLGAIPSKQPEFPTTGRRLAFAGQLTSGKHPLPARVLVNRIWMHHFGRGLVGTPGDFGFLGERPSHPELLDWLADEFIAGGWRIKRLHKLIMTSNAYRQASGSAEREARSAELKTPSALRAPRFALRAREIDPDNRLLARMSVRRLEAEVIRDAMLAINGKLNSKLFGPPVPVMHDDFGQVVLGVDTTDSAGYKQKEIPLGGEEFRRSVYVQVRRSRPLSVLDTFDAPAMTPNCEARNASTVTPQALMLMNSQYIVTQARHFADRVRKEAGKDVRAQIVHAWKLAYTCEPTDPEINEALSFLSEQGAFYRNQKVSDPPQLALACFCQALLSSNRFLYVD